MAGWLDGEKKKRKKKRGYGSFQVSSGGRTEIHSPHQSLQLPCLLLYKYWTFNLIFRNMHSYA